MPQSSLQTDLELIQGFKSGHPGAGEELYSRYYPRTARFCGHYLRSQTDGEDAAQDVFLKIIVKKKLQDFRGDAQLWTWIKRIAVNECINRCRQNHFCQPLHDRLLEDATLPEERLPSPLPTPEEQAVQDEHRERLHVALHSLPARYFTAICVTYLEDRAYKEAARRLKIKVRLLGIYLFRAKKMLVHILKSGEKPARKVRFAH